MSARVGFFLVREVGVPLASRTAAVGWYHGLISC
jgi:hypothetical protein